MEPFKVLDGGAGRREILHMDVEISHQGQCSVHDCVHQFVIDLGLDIAAPVDSLLVAILGKSLHMFVKTAQHGLAFVDEATRFCLECQVPGGVEDNF